MIRIPRSFASQEHRVERGGPRNAFAESQVVGDGETSGMGNAVELLNFVPEFLPEINRKQGVK